MSGDDVTTRPPQVSAVRRAIHGLSRVLVLLSALALVGLVLLTVTHVTLRSLGGRGIAGGIEIVEVVLAAAVFLALAQAQRIDAHVSTSLVTDRLPPRVAALLQSIAYLLAAVFFAWLVFETGRRGIDSWQSGETRVGLRAIPIWPARLIIPLGLAALTLELLVNVADRLAELRSGPPPGRTEVEAG